MAKSKHDYTVYPKKYAHGFVVLCFVVVMQSFIMNSHEVFIHIHQGCFAGTGAIVRLPQCQWSKPDGYGKISQCITTTKHSKAVTVCTFLGIYCRPTFYPAIDTLQRGKTVSTMNFQWTSDAIWRQVSASILAHIIVWCRQGCKSKICPTWCILLQIKMAFLYCICSWWVAPEWYVYYI